MFGFISGEGRVQVAQRDKTVGKGFIGYFSVNDSEALVSFIVCPE